MKRSVRIIGIAIILMTLPVLGLANDEQQATTFFREGIEMFNQGNFAAAVKAFRRAQELKPSWKLYYNIGQSEAALKRYGLAIESFERYMAGGGDDVKQVRRDQVLDELERLRQMVGGVRIEGPDGLKIFVDDVYRGETPLGMEIVVTAGQPQKVELKRGETVVHERTIMVRGGATFDLRISQQEEEPEEALVGVAAEVATVDSVNNSESNGLSPILFWIGVGTSAALAGTTVILDVAVGKKIDEGNGSSDYRSSRDSAKSLQTTERVFGGLTLAAVAATGAIFFFTDFGGDEKQAVSWRTAPWIAGDGVGAVVSGRF